MRDAHFTRERPAPDGMLAEDHAGAVWPDDDYCGRISGGKATTLAADSPSDEETGS
jgi:hypothetical protein